METTVLVEVLIILVLILANGFFAAAEIAIIAARKGTLKQQADEGDRAARLALELANSPDRLLSTVQVGITVITTFAAAFGGVRLVRYLAEGLGQIPLEWFVLHREDLALALIVAAISFCSIILGELVPKRIALQRANRLARLVARPIHWLALLGRPLVWLLGRITDFILAPLSTGAEQQPTVSLEDIKHLIDTGSAEGVLDPVERKLAVEALRLGDRSVRDIMRPRIDIDAIEVNTPPREVLGAFVMAGFSRLPVYEADLDHILGVVHVKDVLRTQYMSWKLDLRRLLRTPLFVPETLSIDRLVMQFQEKGEQLAIVLDEFGGTEGIVTLEDILGRLVGEIVSDRRMDHEQKIVQRDAHSWLVDGAVSIDEMVDRLSLRPSWFPGSRSYSTVAGLVLSHLRRIPTVGETMQWKALTIEVVDMDGPRIDRLLLSLAPDTIEESQAPADSVLPPVSHAQAERL